MKYKFKPYSKNIIFFDSEFSSLDPYKGEILSVGSEIINGQTFLNTNQNIRYGDPKFLDSTPFEIGVIRGVRGLNGGNITLNLDSVRKGKIPPYFHPPGARGEDAILGMQIPDISALKVGVYTFHDSFQKYIGITKGDYPERIEAVKVIPGTIDRFCKACTGWVRYAPFLIRLTSGSEDEYRKRIHAMEQPLEEVGNEIDRQLNWNGFQQMRPILSEYDKQSKTHVRELEQVRSVWSHIVQRI